MSTVDTSRDLSPSTAASLRGLFRDREASWREVTSGAMAAGTVFLAAATAAFAVRVLRRR
jgi:hypothetical protein